MEGNSFGKLGGTLSILLGVSYIVVGIAFFAQPAELRPGGDFDQFWSTMAENPTAHLLVHWAFALGALLALAAVAAISEVVRPANEGWVRWTRYLALLGFAVMAITNFRALAVEPALAQAYVAGNASTQAAIVATTPLIDLNPQGWLGFGAVGVWLLVLNLLALREDTWPKTLAYVGIVGAILYWFVVAGLALGVPLLTAIAAGLGGIIVAPVWYIWMGLRLQGTVT